MLQPLPAGLPQPSLPPVAMADVRALVPGAIALAFLIFAESIVLAQTLAAKRREVVDANTELVALGVGNVASGVLGGYSVGASASRSITADAAGGRSQLVQWVAIALLLAFMLWLAPLIGRLPRVALAAILIVAGIGHARPRRDAVAHTARPTLVLAVARGVGGRTRARRAARRAARHRALGHAGDDRDGAPREALLRRRPNDKHFHDLDEEESGETPPGVVVYRLYAPLIFANARHVAERLRGWSSGPTPRCAASCSTCRR